MKPVADQDIQCLLCDRVVAEWRRGRLQANPNYGADVRAALAARRCGHCGGRLVAMHVVGQQTDLDYRPRPRRRQKPA